MKKTLLSVKLLLTQNRSLFKTLLFLMSKEYMPTTDDDRKMTRVSDNEMNQLFNITQNIQQNFNL